MGFIYSLWGKLGGFAYYAYRIGYDAFICALFGAVEVSAGSGQLASI